MPLYSPLEPEDPNQNPTPSSESQRPDVWLLHALNNSLSLANREISASFWVVATFKVDVRVERLRSVIPDILPPVIATPSAACVAIVPKPKLVLAVPALSTTQSVPSLTIIFPSACTKPAISFKSSSYACTSTPIFPVAALPNPWPVSYTHLTLPPILRV